MATKQIMVEAPKSDRGNGHCDSANLQIMFPGSPVYQGQLTDEIATAEYMDQILSGEINDAGYMFGVVDIDYKAAPNLAEVKIGGAGLPGSPWAPNIAVPPEGQNPADIPAAGVEATADAKGSGGAFQGDGLQSPHNTSAVISGQKIGSLAKGTSTPTG